jgi:hypothetical protein
VKTRQKPEGARKQSAGDTSKPVKTKCLTSPATLLCPLGRLCIPRLPIPKLASTRTRQFQPPASNRSANDCRIYGQYNRKINSPEGLEISGQANSPTIISRNDTPRNAFAPTGKNCKKGRKDAQLLM